MSLEDGSESMGIVTNETAGEITLSLPAGAAITHSRSQIRAVSVGDKSLMPSLAPGMTEQELVDLVEFLSNLKR